MAIEDIKDSLATTASLSTVLLFMTGWFTMNKIIKRKSVGNDSSAPFLTGFLSSSLWLRYGVLIGDASIMLVNTFGAILQLCYISIYVFYSKVKWGIIKQQIVVSMFLMLTLLYTHWEEDVELVKFRVGLLASIITIAFFAAPLTMLMHVIQVKNVECLPFPMIVGSFLVSAQWLLYGYILKDPFIILPNGLGCFLSGVQLSLFAVYPSTSDVLKPPV